MVRSIYCGTHIVQHVTDYTTDHMGRLRPAEQFCDFCRGGSKYVTRRALQRSLGIPEYRVSGVALLGTNRIIRHHDIFGALRY